MLLKFTMCSMFWNAALLFLLLGTAVGEYHKMIVNVSATSSKSQKSCILNTDTYVNNLKYRVRKPNPPTNITVKIIDDGKIVGAFYNDSTEMKLGIYFFPLNTTFVKSGTMVRIQFQ
ncbi:uncharacterized protein LOC117104159 [Anneissia japonica]|uniref:uncharacterized protein LOC117104159 n=1 Tax=Anneissia japonica TaxID=1529436 RepID=UPI0014256088|nr:uncharacterized protein LOC117104159 [Anneissia japonica]